MAHNLAKLISSTNNARMRLRLLAVSHFLDGKSRTQIALFLKVSRTSVNKWIHAYLHNGVDGLKEKKHPGRPKSLNNTQLAQLKNSSLIVRSNLMEADYKVRMYNITLLKSLVLFIKRPMCTTLCIILV